MSAGYLESLKWWDKPTIYWPIITLSWIGYFLLYVRYNDIFIFYYALAITVAVLAGVHIRNYFR